jgi:hypothetical protein
MSRLAYIQPRIYDGNRPSGLRGSPQLGRDLDLTAGDDAARVRRLFRPELAGMRRLFRPELDP